MKQTSTSSSSSAVDSGSVAFITGGATDTFENFAAKSAALMVFAELFPPRLPPRPLRPPRFSFDLGAASPVSELNGVKALPRPLLRPPPRDALGEVGPAAAGFEFAAGASAIVCALIFDSVDGSRIVASKYSFAGIGEGWGRGMEDLLVKSSGLCCVPGW